MKAYEIINLINYTVNKIVPKKYQEIEKIVILTKIKEISRLTKKNLNQQQVLEITYKQLGVEKIWVKWLNGLQFTKSNFKAIH